MCDCSCEIGAAMTQITQQMPRNAAGGDSRLDDSGVVGRGVGKGGTGVPLEPALTFLLGVHGDSLSPGLIHRRFRLQGRRFGCLFAQNSHRVPVRHLFRSFAEHRFGGKAEKWQIMSEPVRTDGLVVASL